MLNVFGWGDYGFVYTGVWLTESLFFLWCLFSLIIIRLTAGWFVQCPSYQHHRCTPVQRPNQPIANAVPPAVRRTKSKITKVQGKNDTAECSQYKTQIPLTAVRSLLTVSPKYGYSFTVPPSYTTSTAVSRAACRTPMLSPCSSQMSPSR